MCRDIPRYSYRQDKHSPICVNETTEVCQCSTKSDVKFISYIQIIKTLLGIVFVFIHFHQMKRTGCAIHTLDVSAFLNSTYEDQLENSFHVEATVTEEGTGDPLSLERRVLKSDFIKMQVSLSPYICILQRSP